ncbi:MAG: hypothetical protein WBA79_01570, partial [Mycobacterium sp.]
VPAGPAERPDPMEHRASRASLGSLGNPATLTEPVRHNRSNHRPACSDVSRAAPAKTAPAKV